MITLNEFIKMVCDNLRMVVPKIQKKFSPSSLAYYDENKDVLILKKDEDNYDLRFAITVALRKAYQVKSKMDLSDEESLIDCYGYGYFYFDKYYDLKVEFDQFDQNTIGSIIKESEKFKKTY